MQTKNCQCERAVQTEDGKLVSYAYNRQDVDAQKHSKQKVAHLRAVQMRNDTDTQSQHNADNANEPSVITNPVVMGNNNNKNSFLSELIINENQRFVSEQLREDDTVTNIKQASQRENNSSESFISDQSKDPDMETKTTN